MTAPKRTEYDTLYTYLTALSAYEDRQIARLKNWQIDTTPKPIYGIVYGKTYTQGHRVIFMVVNSIGQRAYTDTSADAMTISRDAVNQPCKIVVLPIMPIGNHLHTPLEKLRPLLEQSIGDYCNDK